MGVSENSGTPKSSILIGLSIINHPFWGTLIFGNAHIYISEVWSLKISFSTTWPPDHTFCDHQHPGDIQKDAIEHVFKTYGTVNDVHIMTGKSLGEMCFLFKLESHVGCGVFSYNMIVITENPCT